jgi:hypothetical protein
MRRAIPPLPQYASMAWCLVKHRDNFTFTCVFTYFNMYHPHFHAILPFLETRNWGTSITISAIVEGMNGWMDGWMDG